MLWGFARGAMTSVSEKNKNRREERHWFYPSMLSAGTMPCWGDVPCYRSGSSRPWGLWHGGGRGAFGEKQYRTDYNTWALKKKNLARAALLRGSLAIGGLFLGKSVPGPFSSSQPEYSTTDFLGALGVLARRADRCEKQLNLLEHNISWMKKKKPLWSGWRSGVWTTWGFWHVARISGTNLARCYRLRKKNYRASYPGGAACGAALRGLGSPGAASAGSALAKFRLDV